MSLSLSSPYPEIENNEADKVQFLRSETPKNPYGLSLFSSFIQRDIQYCTPCEKFAKTLSATFASIQSTALCSKVMLRLGLYRFTMYHSKVHKVINNRQTQYSYVPFKGTGVSKHDKRNTNSASTEIKIGMWNGKIDRGTNNRRKSLNNAVPDLFRSLVKFGRRSNLQDKRIFQYVPRKSIESVLIPGGFSMSVKVQLTPVRGPVRGLSFLYKENGTFSQVKPQPPLYRRKKTLSVAPMHLRATAYSIFRGCKQ